MLITYLFQHAFDKRDFTTPNLRAVEILTDEDNVVIDPFYGLRRLKANQICKLISVVLNLTAVKIY